MLDHEQFPEKPQYNVATHPFLDKPPCFALLSPPLPKISRLPPISINSEKVKLPPLSLYEGGGKLCILNESYWYILGYILYVVKHDMKE